MKAKYEVINNTIEQNINGYMAFVKEMYDHPELGFKEYESQKLLVNYLMFILEIYCL